MRQKMKKLEANIVIPTYNESDNIIPLLDEIFKQVDFENGIRKPEDRVDVYVFVVDDNSPDKTADLVRDYMKKERRVYLHFRKEKEGLGAAYKDGMKSAVRKFNPDFVFEMDADFSHSPKDIFRMLDELKRGSDFVIGSRYIEGGSTPEGWGIHRKLLSFSARKITGIGLGLTRIKDSSGGFRGIKSDVIKTIDMDNLICDGYCFQASLLEEANHNGFKITEIPIQFNNRNKGESKMRLKDMIEGLELVFRVRLKRTKEGFSRMFGSSGGKIVQNGRKKHIGKMVK
jgi:dolichol-phosphate mannosyltransferase